MTTVRICVRSYFELVVPVKCQIHIYLRVSNEINLMGGKKRLVVLSQEKIYATCAMSLLYILHFAYYKIKHSTFVTKLRCFVSHKKSSSEHCRYKVLLSQRNSQNT